MTEEELPVSNEFTTWVKIELTDEQQQQLHRFLNLHYLGDVNCNEMNKDGFYVAKYPEKETEEFKNAVSRAHATHEFEIKVVYDVNGGCKLELL